MSILNPIEQTSKMPTLKESYSFASTDAILSQLAEKGWTPRSTSIMRVNKEHRKGFQKHLIRLQNPAFPEIPGLSLFNKSTPEIIIQNSHDGGGALRMLLGLFRVVCLNGVIAGAGLRSFRAYHTGTLTQKVPEGIEYMTAGLPDLFNAVGKLQQTQFTAEAKQEFINTLVQERFKNKGLISYDAVTVDAPRREADKENNAFTTFNRVQESLMRGGIKYVARVDILDSLGNKVGEEEKAGVTRRIVSIPASIRLNTLAFDTALRLAA